MLLCISFVREFSFEKCWFVIVFGVVRVFFGVGWLVYNNSYNWYSTKKEGGKSRITRYQKCINKTLQLNQKSQGLLSQTSQHFLKIS